MTPKEQLLAELNTEAYRLVCENWNCLTQQQKNTVLADEATAERELLFEFIDWKEANGWQYVGKTTSQLFVQFLTTKTTTP